VLIVTIFVFNGDKRAILVHFTILLFCYFTKILAGQNEPQKALFE
jgi:hypothetical protein